MKPFSKKTDLTLLILSVAFLILSSLLVLFASQILLPLQAFFTNFFHRSVNLSRWAETIVSLMTFPLFAVVVFDAIIFLKFSDRSKTILILTAFVLTAFFITYIGYTRGKYCIDDDIASDIMLAKECWLSKTFFPRTWHYSTEFRILQAQLFAAPLFAFTQNWTAVKAISALLSALCLPASLYFLLCVIDVKKLWRKLLFCLLVFVPASVTSWCFVQYGNWYAFHTAIGFLYFGLFFGLIYKNYSARKKAVFKWLFYALSFLMGLTSMRYLVQFIGPLFIVYAIDSLSNKIRQGDVLSVKKIFGEKPVMYSAIGCAIAFVAFLMNQIVLSRFYTFSFTGTFAFGNLGDIPIGKCFYYLLELMGYRNNVSVLSPAGIVNGLIFVAALTFVLSSVDFLRHSKSQQQRMVVIFSFVAFAINVVATISFEYNLRYLIVSFWWILPCTAIFFEGDEVFPLKRAALIFSLSVSIFTASFFTYGNISIHDEDVIERNVANFLEENGYGIGFSRSGEAIVTFLTNGNVEMGQVYYKKRKFLTSKRFYDADYKANEKAFLMISENDFEDYPELFELENCAQVYKDSFYTVFEFRDKASLWKELEKEKYESFLDPH